MTRTRVLLVALAVGWLMAPLAAGAQPPAGRPWRIGVLTYLYPEDADPPRAFAQRLHDLGYVEGQNVVIDWRNAQGKEDRLPGFAVELVRRNPDVIVADATLAIRAAQRATPTIPIVMMGSADAVGVGLVSNLARPGGNVTGLTILLAEMTAKRLQLLKDAVPKAARVAVLWNPATLFHKAMLKEAEAAAPALRIQPVAITVRSRDDLGDALAEVTVVWAELRRGVPARRGVRRQDLEGRPPRGPARRAADEVRARHQPENRQDTRPRYPAVDSRARGRGDPVRSEAWDRQMLRIPPEARRGPWQNQVDRARNLDPVRRP